MNPQQRSWLDLLISIGLLILTAVSAVFWWNYDLAVYAPWMKYAAGTVAVAVLVGMFIYDWTRDQTD